MTIGKITKLIKDRGFGFITDDFGTLYFFHYSAINPKSSIKFDNLIEGMEVEFTGEPGDKGPRAKPRTLLVKSNNGNNSNNLSEKIV